MATFELSGTASGLIKYTDDNNAKIRIIIAHIVSYSRSGDGFITVSTAKNDLRLDLNTKAAVTTAIVLLDSKF